RRVFRCCLLTPRPQQMGENSALVCSTPDTVNPSAEPTVLDPHLLADWERLLAQADDPVAGLLAEGVAGNGPALADRSCDGRRGGTRAARFLVPERVGGGLEDSLERWLRELVVAEGTHRQAVSRLAGHVVQVHARMGLPGVLVVGGVPM